MEGEETEKQDNNEEWVSERKEGVRTAKGEIGKTVLARNVDGVGNETVKGLSDHG